MESLYLLIPIALLLIVIAAALFFWAAGNGQFDDLDNEAHRILFDEKTNHDPQAASSAKPKGEVLPPTDAVNHKRDGQ